MSDLEKILNDDLLKCKIVESVENPVRRVDLIKWTHDNTYSIAEVRKDTGKLEVTDLKAASGLKAMQRIRLSQTRLLRAEWCARRIDCTIRYQSS